MSVKQNINIADYTYVLPDEKIAKYPLTQRDRSKLLVYKQGKISDDTFHNVDKYIPNNSLILYNNTRVIHARLLFYKETGAKIEIFCLEPSEPSDHQLAFATTGQTTWKCMVGNLKKWKGGVLSKKVKINGTPLVLRAELIEKSNNAQCVAFKWQGDFTFSEIIECIGEIPIPPYLNRESEENDKKVYQTVYAKNEGSVAAPTAGLHFTTSVFDKLKAKSIETNEVTLHVGAGTFQPVKTDDVKDHEMHAEWISVKRSTIEHLQANMGNITAVGTTTVRTLESLYWAGLLISQKSNLHPNEILVNQWIPYSQANQIDTRDSLKTILQYLDKNNLDSIRFFTRIIIVPGYAFKIVNRIITNFHQPNSTLLLLVSAFVKGDWKNIYKHALANNYRFLSYGDSSILIP